MFRYFAKHALRLTDEDRIAAVNKRLLYDSTPALKSGVLYLDGEGTASAYIARRGAELYLSDEFNRVVIAGSRKARDWKTSLVAHRLQKDGQPLPQAGETEAGYIRRVFADAVGMALFKALTKSKNLYIVDGANTGEKIRNARAFLLDGNMPIQAVTLAYSQRRVHGTLRQELEDGPVISVEAAYPLGFTKENWNKDWLSYGTVMDEADKTGPRFDGKPPAYRRFFRDIDVEAEIQRIKLTCG